MALRYIPYELLYKISGYLKGQDIYSLAYAIGCRTLLYDDNLWTSIIRAHYNVSRDKYLTLNMTNTRRYHKIETWLTTKFYKLVEKGDLEGIQFLNSYSACNDIHHVLGLSIEYDQLEVFKYSVYHTGNVNANNIFNRACYCVALNIIKYLIGNGVDRHIIDSNFRNALEHCRYGVVDILIDHIDNIAQHRDDIRFPIINGSLHYVKMLLERGWCPGFALYYACYHDKQDIIRYIIDNHKLKDKDINDCIHVSFRNGQLFAIKYLLRKSTITLNNLYAYADKHECYHLLYAFGNPDYIAKPKQDKTSDMTLKDLRSMDKSYKARPLNFKFKGGKYNRSYR